MKIFKVLFMIALATGCSKNSPKSAEVDRNSAPDQEKGNTDQGEPASPTAVKDDWYMPFIEFVRAEQQKGIVGLAVAIVQSDKVIFSEGLGFSDMAAKQKVNSDTLFHLGSIHKSMTSMAVGIQVDRGKLKLTSRAVELYPDFQLGSGGDDITIKNLLSMTAGIAAAEEDNIEDFDLDPLDLFAQLVNSTPLAAPGQKFEYSNISASLAGYLAAISNSGSTTDLREQFRTLMKKDILDPIGMKSSFMLIADAVASGRMSKAYEMVNGQPQVAQPEDIAGDVLAPSGSLKTTILDMAKYISTQINDGVAPNGTRVISKSVLAESRVPVLENYGLGWDINKIDGKTLLSHEGAFDFFLNSAGFIPADGVGYIILTNTEEAAENLMNNCNQQFVNAWNNRKK